MADRLDKKPDGCWVFLGYYQADNFRCGKPETCQSKDALPFVSNFVVKLKVWREFCCIILRAKQLFALETEKRP